MVNIPAVCLKINTKDMSQVSIQDNESSMPSLKMQFLRFIKYQQMLNTFMMVILDQYGRDFLSLCLL